MDKGVIDRTVVEELVEGLADGDPELFLELAGMFVHDSTRRATRILEAAVKGDLATVEHEVHALRGAAGHLGAVRVAQVTESLQVAARQGDRPAVGTLAADLERELGDAVRELTALADGYR